jgi:hypothetical protein
MTSSRTTTSIYIAARIRVNAVNAKTTPVSIVNRLFIAKWSSSSLSVHEKCENPIGVPLVSC